MLLFYKRTVIKIKLYYKDSDGNFNEIGVEGAGTENNIFGNFNGFLGGETSAQLKIQAEEGEDLKNICVRVFEQEVKSGGAVLEQYMMQDGENKQYLKSIIGTSIKIKFTNKPYKNGLVFLTDTLNCVESVETPGEFPNKEFEFSITAVVAERTVTEILTNEVKNISLEFIYN